LAEDSVSPHHAFLARIVFGSNLFLGFCYVEEMDLLSWNIHKGFFVESVGFYRFLPKKRPYPSYTAGGLLINVYLNLLLDFNV